MSLVFIGPPAAGKSRMGKRIATKLGVSWADTDKLIVHDHGSIAEFIPKHGEASFRAIEREAVHAALRDYEVVSLGGGAVLNEETQRELASGEHTVVLLVASPEAIEERIRGKRNRPLLSGIDSWIATYEARRSIYERLADVTVDTSFRPMWQACNEVCRYLESIGSPLVSSEGEETPVAAASHAAATFTKPHPGSKPAVPDPTSPKPTDPNSSSLTIPEDQ